METNCLWYSNNHSLHGASQQKFIVKMYRYDYHSLMCFSCYHTRKWRLLPKKKKTKEHHRRYNINYATSFVYDLSTISSRHGAWFFPKSATLLLQREIHRTHWRTKWFFHSFWKHMIWNYKKYIKTKFKPETNPFLNFFIFSTILNCCHRLEKLIPPSGWRLLFPMWTNVKSCKTNPLKKIIIKLKFLNFQTIRTCMVCKEAECLLTLVDKPWNWTMSQSESNIPSSLPWYASATLIDE